MYTLCSSTICLFSNENKAYLRQIIPGNTTPAHPHTLPGMVPQYLMRSLIIPAVMSPCIKSKLDHNAHMLGILHTSLIMFHVWCSRDALILVENKDIIIEHYTLLPSIIITVY